jgi:hypothetical protein
MIASDEMIAIIINKERITTIVSGVTSFNNHRE